MKWNFRAVRDPVLLVFGLVLLGNETLFTDEPRLYLLLMAAGMLGIPAALGADNLFTTKGKRSDDE